MTPEHRHSRIKQTRALIKTKGLSGLLNNTKWLEIFEWIRDSRIGFDIKLLSESKARHCSFIRELENTSILVDDKGDFIEFLEIESITLKGKKESIEYIDILGVEYFEDGTDLIVQGYRS